MEPGKLLHVPIRCKGEEMLIKLLSKLDIVCIYTMLYEYGSTKRLMSKEECDAMLLLIKRNL